LKEGVREGNTHRELGGDQVDWSIVLTNPSIGELPSLWVTLGSTNAVGDKVMNVTLMKDLVLSQGNKLLIAGIDFESGLRPWFAKEGLERYWHFLSWGCNQKEA
jgi:hypothetical protein